MLHAQNHGRAVGQHWTHLALRALLQATLSQKNMARIAATLLEVEFENASDEPAPKVDEADAQDCIDGVIAEALCKAHEIYGNGPIHPAAFGASHEFHIPADQIYTLLRLCRGIRTEERLRLITAPNAMTTIVGELDELNFKWALMSGLLPGWRCTDRYVGEPERIFVTRMRDVGSTRPRFSMTSIMGMRNPVLLTMDDGDEKAPDPIAHSETMRILLAPPDRTLIMWMIALRHPETPRAELDRLRQRLPSKQALANMSENMLLASFRAPSARDTVRALKTASKTEPPPPVTGLRLADLAGYGEAKTIALQIVEDLKSWERGELPWSDVSRGLLLYGPPGVGKTELARAMAREPGISLVIGNHSTWQKCGHLGDTLAAMDLTFKEARENTPCILWIDEIDSFGSRTADNTRNQSYDTKLINGLLAHLDGITERDGVVVLAACNHPQMLDEAIKRAGRFDRHIRIDLPDRDDLAIILRQHLGSDLPNTDLTPIAVRASGLSGADCAAAIRNARAIARAAKRALSVDDLIAGLGGTGECWSAETLEMTAYHEAGHAIVAAVLNVGEPSSLRLDNTGGLFSITKPPPVETLDDLQRLRAVDLAGRAAERLVYGVASPSAGGASGSDLAVATSRALKEELSYGLGSSGPLWFGSKHEPETLLRLPAEMRNNVRRMLETAEDRALRILEANRPVLDALAAALLEHRIVADAELRSFLSSVVDVETGARP